MNIYTIHRTATDEILKTYTRKADVTRFFASHFNGVSLTGADKRFHVIAAETTSHNRPEWDNAKRAFADPRPGTRQSFKAAQVDARIKFARRALRKIAELNDSLQALVASADFLNPKSKIARAFKREIMHRRAWQHEYTQVIRWLPDGIFDRIYKEFGDLAIDNLGIELEQRGKEAKRHLAKVKETTWKVTRIFASRHKAAKRIGIVTNGNFTAWVYNPEQALFEELREAGCTSRQKARRIGSPFNAVLTYKGDHFTAQLPSLG